MTRHRLIPTILCTAALLVGLTACSPDAGNHAATSTGSQAGPSLPQRLARSQIAALPEATYNSVIPELLPAATTATVTTTHRVPFDTALYGNDLTTPIARLDAKNFLGDRTVVVRIATKGQWSLVLTPARQQLPSKASAKKPAPAQSAAWIPTRDLLPGKTLTRKVVISTSKQTLDIVDGKGKSLKSFPAGVGTDATPTPAATGYLQARYLDPAQGQTRHRIQLTSLHATAADEPYGGSDGGLIGIHFQSSARGAVSHGCIRLSAEAIAAVDALPLGTAVQITG
ncbi:L,D-transpeptidase [Leifsonia sp. SIMBA_070]|uniref:L,D-transpeptidase n=1 Tax=Leifsonia sp. SIMBA_070 TaxID=3085810 RepID=UPI00397C1202